MLIKYFLRPTIHVSVDSITHVKCIILSLNILNDILEKIMKIWYFENTHRDEFNYVLYDIIYLYILVEKYSQSKLPQNYTFLNESSIENWRE